MNFGLGATATRSLTLRPALLCCAVQGVANRDMKLDNTLLVDRGTRPLVKLADFGFSKDENSQSAPSSRVGTPAYLAPEVVANKEGQQYDAKVSGTAAAAASLTGGCQMSGSLLPSSLYFVNSWSSLGPAAAERAMHVGRCCGGGDSAEQLCTHSYTNGRRYLSPCLLAANPPAHPSMA